MTNNTRLSRDFSKSLWEIFFALNLGGAAVCVIFGLSFATDAFFSRLETRIKIFLHMRQTDLVVGHLTNWIPTVLLALVTWVLLRKLAGTLFMAAFVRRAAGVITISTPLVVPPWFYLGRYWPELWRLGALSSEMIVAIAMIWRFQSGRWNPPAVLGLGLLAVHFAFWWFLTDRDVSVSLPPGYGGPAGPILGFCAAIAWCRYVSTWSGAGPG